MASKGRTINFLDPLTVERATYTEIRSKGATSPGIDPRTGKPKQNREGALLGNRLSDGDSLYLFITPNNAKSWRMDYSRPICVPPSYGDAACGEAFQNSSAPSRGA